MVQTRFFPIGTLILLAVGFVPGFVSGLFLEEESPLTDPLLDLNQSSNSTAIHSTSSASSPSMTHPDWCPQAHCTNTDLCHPCHRRFLIIIATGRSASTTLTWMMNELPGVRMGGENNDELHAIYEMEENVYGRAEFLRGAGQINSWGHNEIPDQTFACVAQHAMEAIIPPKLINNSTLEDPDSVHDIVGFKTIRFVHGEDDDTHYHHMIDFVQENFPCSRILVNINSNVKRQVESYNKSHFGVYTESEIEAINREYQEVNTLFNEKGIPSYLLDSAEWTEDISKLNDAVQWMGFDASCDFKETLEFNTEGNGYQNGKTELEPRDPKCTKLA